MLDALTIFVDRLRGGQTERVSASVSIEELGGERVEDVQFPSKVEVSGQVYIASHEVVCDLAIVCPIVGVCRVCNRPVHESVEVARWLQIYPLKEIKGGKLELESTVREALYLHLPALMECEGGQCPRRKEIKPFLRKEKPSSEEWHPFEQL